MSGEFEVSELRARILELEGKVNFLYKHLDVEYVKEMSESDQKVADVLKYKEKCDFIICLSHLGWDAIAQGLICDPALINQTRNIDMVLGGHSHTLIQHPIYYKNLDGKEIPNTQMGARGVYVGRMDIKLIKK